MLIEQFPSLLDSENSLSIVSNKDEDQNCKKKNPKKSGGFNAMGLNINILKSISKRGYKQPTPIQRKAIPIILQGRDVVAMARTGSGKTACFLLPLFEKLKIRSSQTGSRAIIFSPTRELALQTMKFFKELGKFVGLKSVLILGGDSMDDQFNAIHGNPDVIIATPGRFLHVCIEMDLKLNNIEYVVFDEADRLFEMGLGDQLTEILQRLPDSRQTLLFSATLPKILVEFTKAGLKDPILVRLDAQTKIPEELKLSYILVRSDEKLSALIVLLKTHLKENEKTIVFVATKHHVEYIHTICDKLNINNTYIYSDLHPTARKINAAKFTSGKTNVLIVTDLAARGIDIPLLDNVINFHFPAKPKLFVHRVGRCARAGRSGTAYSLVSPDEYAYLLDLHLFLGHTLSIITVNNRKANIGKMPQHLIEEQQSSLVALHDDNDMKNLQKTSANGYKHYLRTRPVSSSDSNRRIKELPFDTCGINSIFSNLNDESNDLKENFINKMKTYRPHGTIFEICGKNNSPEYTAMKQKRLLHKEKILTYHKYTESSINDLNSDHLENTLPTCSNNDIKNTFKNVIEDKKRKFQTTYKPNKKFKKDDNFIPYAPIDQHTEMGFAVNNFKNEANNAHLELSGDTNEMLNRNKKWDRVKKKFINVEDKRKGKIKTESGVWVSASYKSNRYVQWKEKNKILNQNDNIDDNGNVIINKQQPTIHKHWVRHNEKLKLKQKMSEIKNNQQILKNRKIVEMKKNKSGKKKKTNKNKK